MSPLVSVIKMYLLLGALERRPLLKALALILISARQMCWESSPPYTHTMRLNKCIMK